MGAKPVTQRTGYQKVTDRETSLDHCQLFVAPTPRDGLRGHGYAREAIRI